MNPDSFPKHLRLSEGKDIREVLEKGRKYVGSLIILYVKGTGGQALKAGFVVSKKVGPATVRNRIKRLMRETFRRQKKLFGEGLSLLFLARPGSRDWTFSKVFDEITLLREKIK